MNDLSDYVLSCCSTVDVTEEHLLSRGIHCFPFHFFLGETEYPDDLGKTMRYEEFYRRMAEGEMTRTSQIGSGEFIDGFEAFLKEGKDILHVSLSSGISGVFNSACIARDYLKERYPERTIIVVDSRAASSGYGLLMDLLADKRDEGLSLQECADWAEANKLRVHHWFFSTDLSYYVRGGRISKASGWFGTLLKICPLLNMDPPGHLIPRYKYRGKDAVRKAIVRKMEAHAEGGADYDGKCYISQSDCREDAEKVAALIEESFPKLKGKVEINWIGTTIGAHTGPGTVALFFVGDPRDEDPESASPKEK